MKIQLIDFKGLFIRVNITVASVVHRGSLFREYFGVLL